MQKGRSIMANNLRNAEKSLAQVNMGKIKVELVKGKNPKQCVRCVFTLGDITKTVSTSSFYGDQFIVLFEDMKNSSLKNVECSMATSKVEKSYDGQHRDTQTRTYVKEAYRNTQLEFKALNDLEIEKRMISNMQLESCKNLYEVMITILEEKGVPLEFFEKNRIPIKKSCAILYKGLYITPCVLSSAFKKVLNTKKEQFNSYVEKYNIAFNKKISKEQACYKHALFNKHLNELRA